MKGFLESVSKFVAKIYNLVPGDIKIILYPALLTMAVAYLALAGDDIRQIMLTAGRYEVPALVFVLTLIGGVIGYLIKKGANQGEKVLVAQGDTSTINKLENKVVEAEKVLEKKPE